MTTFRQAALAVTLVGAALLATPLAAFADVFVFLSNPASGGSFPTASGTTGGTNGSLINYNASLSTAFGVRRLSLTVTANPSKPSSLVATQVLVNCSGGVRTMSAPSGGPGWVTPAAASMTVSCPFLQTSQTGWFNVDAF